ncbi:MAG: hypothetical protein IKQ41_10070 [Clostridia bacterium]|nr:hypothetical protein [Clostridia bacterium]
MPGIWKRVLALLCAGTILFSCAGALADFSPRYTALEARDGMTAQLSFQLESLTPLSESSLQRVNEWLDRASFLVGTGDSSLMDLSMDGESVFSISQRQQQGLTLTSFGPSNAAYLTDDNTGDMLSLLSDDNWALTNLSRLPAAYAQIASALYDHLQTIVDPKAVPDRTSIKNASASTSYENYLLSAEQMNGAWPDLLGIILPAIKTVLSDQPYLYARVEPLLRSVTFTGECRFKRFLDKENGDMGMQFTGQAEKDGDERKITLFGGWTPNKGGYISLSLPAVSGKNTWKANLAAQLSEKNGLHTLALEGSYTRKLDSISVSGELEATLKNQVTDESEKWTGKLSITMTENKEKTAWTIQPDLTFTDDGLKGDIKLQRKTGNAVTLKGTARLLLTAGAPEAKPISGAKDLRGETAQRIREAAIEELSPLASLLADLFSGLEENERTHLLHDLRTDEWMNGDS